jgi:hypothetical protein
MTKRDFVFGLENAKIKLPARDIDIVFNYLDETNDGNLNQLEFNRLFDN